MARNPADDFVDEFPQEEEFVDHSGRSRRFLISIRRLVAGDIYVEARELAQVEGYRFEVYSLACSVPALGSALGDLRGKIRKAIATRYLHADAEGRKNLTHDTIQGRISCNGLVVDGELLDFEDLKKILTTHEGFEISIRITDPTR